jgi:outer membrane protein
MKKNLLLLSLFFGLGNIASAATLMDAYQQALCSDQIFQQALQQRLSTKEAVPISLSNLLPSANINATPDISRSSVTGSAPSFIGSNTQRGYDLALTLNQTIFNFSQFANLYSARSTSKGADATLNAAAQSLILRVASAYFAVLNDEDNLSYTVAAKNAYAKQLDQVKQQYNVGLKTITDVYTAQASYQSSQSDYIAAQTQLEDDKENLRVITGTYYNSLAKLSEDFPLISPQPADIEQWVCTAERQNWQIKASQYAADAARTNIKQQAAGHLPTLSAQASYDINYTDTITSNFITNTAIPPEPGPGPSPIIPGGVFSFNGTTKTSTKSGSLILNVPLVQGGLVLATTRKAQYDYQVAMAQLDQQVRTTINTTRQSYLGVMSNISKIRADKEAIKSTISSLQGLKAAYEVGTETLVDVVNQQQQVVRAQKQYSSDRYAYVNNLLQLKNAAGTLSCQDLEAINSWLIRENDDP